MRTWVLRSLPLALLCLLTSCPSSAPTSILPSCDVSHGNDDCRGHGSLRYCVALGGGSSDAHCTACRTDSDCDDHVFCNGIERCETFGCMHVAPIACNACSYCAEGLQRCVPNPDTDADSDGHRSIECGGDDCDDTDPTRYPGNVEVCDRSDHDEDCDPMTYGVRDTDADGHPDATCCNVDSGGYRHCGDDCDDSRPDIHPALDESCDGVDNDCDGVADESVNAALYVDADGDGWGTGAAQRMCVGSAGYALQDGDCDDTKAALHPGTFRCGGSGSAIDVCGDDGRWSELACPGGGECVSQPDGSGVCESGVLPECADGTDNDGDGLIDALDPDCSSSTDDSEHPQRCGDGIDNDGDHLVDYPNDPGCTSREDTDEADPSALPACGNGLDDDGDGTADYAGGHGDPGCSSASDDSERNPTGPQCDNGADDDGDTKTDYPDDPECSGPLDDNEGTPACSNGIDDDGDGLKDYVVASNFNDPGCTDAKDDSERGVPGVAPTCDNGVDDDGDGAADYPADRGCTGPADTTE